MTTPDPNDTFLQEAQDLLEQLEQTLLDLEQAPQSGNLIDTAFRALHTLKGSGAMFGFERMAAFAHHLETAFDMVRKGKLAPGRELVAVALAAQDHIRRLIDEPGTVAETESAAILADLGRLVDTAPGKPEKAAAPVTTQKGWSIRFRLPEDAMATGTNPLLLIDELRGMGQAQVSVSDEAVPVLEDIDPAGCYLAWRIELLTDKPRDAIEQVFLFVFDDMELAIEPIMGAPLEKAQEPALPAAETGKPNREETRPNREESRNAAGDSIRVPAQRLDELMDRVGELVIVQSRLKQVAHASSDPQVKAISEDIERLALELRDSTMGVRMVPFGSLFGRFRRLIHDLSRELGKEIDLITSGEDTELDKTVIERLNDPLIHLMRNALDHGLEDGAGRAAAGKPKKGRIALSATHAGAEVLISLKDDGRGLDRERIRTKAEENGLIPPGGTYTDAELFQLIFQPGFSTAKEITNLSGRGVGMDVVKRTIEALRGTIDIASTPGSGTEVTLRLPLTLAIIDGLLIRVGTGRYVIPLASVEECVELPAGNTGLNGRNFLNIRGAIVPFLRLRELFNTQTPPDPYQKVVVVSSGDMRVGLVVDQVIGDHQTVIKSMSRLHADVETFSGATILGDGTVALILEIPHLVAFGQSLEDRVKAAE
jgi:two-component system chemotaxis sensor kinase CheA